MKRLIIISIFLIIFFNLNRCNSTCNGENPTLKFYNNASNNAAVVVTTSDTSTLNISTITPGSSTTAQSYTAGTISFVFTITGGAVYNYSYTASNCYDYTVNIGDSSATITTTAE